MTFIWCVRVRVRLRVHVRACLGGQVGRWVGGWVDGCVHTSKFLSFAFPTWVGRIFSNLSSLSYFCFSFLNSCFYHSFSLNFLDKHFFKFLLTWLTLNFIIISLSICISFSRSTLTLTLTSFLVYFVLLNII